MAWVKFEKTILYDGDSETAAAVLEVCNEMLSGEKESVRRELRHRLDDAPPQRPAGRLLSLIEAEARADVSERCSRLFRSTGGRPLRITRGFFSRNSRRAQAPSPAPPPRVVRNLTAASGTRDFEQARRMWLVDIAATIEEGHPDFDSTCDLCGPKGAMRTNYFLRKTGEQTRTLRVGSTCVQRFIILPGTTTQEESARAFSFQERLRRTALAMADTLNRLLAGARVSQEQATDLLALIHHLRQMSCSEEHFRTSLECARVPAGKAEEAMELFRDPSLYRRYRAQIVRTRAREKIKSRIRHVLLVGIGRSRSTL